MLPRLVFEGEEGKEEEDSSFALALDVFNILGALDEFELSF